MEHRYFILGVNPNIPYQNIMLYHYCFQGVKKAQPVQPAVADTSKSHGHRTKKITINFIKKYIFGIVACLLQ